MGAAMRKTITIPNPPSNVVTNVNISTPISAVIGDPYRLRATQAVAPSTSYDLITETGIEAPNVRNIIFAKIVSPVSGLMTLTLNGAIIESAETGPSGKIGLTNLQAPIPMAPGDTCKLVFETSPWIPSGATVYAFLTFGDTS